MASSRIAREARRSDRVEPRGCAGCSGAVGSHERRRAQMRRERDVGERERNRAAIDGPDLALEVE